MAKIRRVVRKVQTSGGDYFDEHLWPVFIALVVLGGFLMGISAAYLKFTDTPWYANAVTSLILIPLVIALFMFGFCYIDNRLVRRSMQLSVVLCAILHVALIVQMLETKLFSSLFEEPAGTREVVQRRPPKVIPEYRPEQMMPAEDRPRQDFEKPVETQTPEPEEQVTEIVRQPEQEKQESPPEPQPVPVPEQVATTEPNVVKRPQPNEAAPRQADQSSKLSRQSKPSEVKVSQVAEVEQITEPKPTGVEASAAKSTVKRQDPQATPTAKQATEAPSSTQETPQPRVARQTTEPSTEPQATTTPTLKRAVATPSTTPRSQVAVADAPATSKSTTPTELAPSAVSPTKRVATSVETQPMEATELPLAKSTPDTTPQRAELPSQQRPQMAQAEQPSPTRQTRATSRPDVATAAAVVAPGQASPAQQTTELAPAATSIARASAEVSSPRASATPATEPNVTNPSQAAARVARASGQPAPIATANPQAAPTRTRATGAPSIAQATPAEVAPAAPTTSPTSGELSPSSLATRRQTTAESQAAPMSGEPTTAAIASPSPSNTPSETPRRSTVASTAGDAPPSDSPAQPTPSARSSTNAAVANIVTTASDVPTNAAPTTAANANPGPSSATISRQSAPSSVAASRTQSPADTASASPATQITAGSMSRVPTAQSPSILPAATAGAPRRAVAESATATSPAAVESPAAAVAQGSGDQSAEPARMALSRSLAGTAGAGRSPNFDRSVPGADSPAQVASSAARRAEATQQAEPGDALSPSAPASLARSRSGADAPTASLRAQPTEVATAAGGAEVAELTASSSAALARADANARPSQVTGAPGATDVDLGSTQIVAEQGMGRASGGGQAQINFDTQSPQIARRSSAGGAPIVSLASAEVGEATSAPMADGGGQPSAAEPDATSLATNRTTAGGESTLSGGPSRADEAGPITEVNSAAMLANSQVSRADNSTGQASGGGDPAMTAEEEEEERKRRLARAAMGGAPALALSAPVTAELPTSPMGEGGDGGTPSPEPSATSTLASNRQITDGGAPAGGAPQSLAAAGEPGDSGAETAGPISIARAEAAESNVGPAEAGGGTAAPTRQAKGAAFVASTQAEVPEMGGMPESGGSPSGAPLEAQGVDGGRLAGGARATAESGPSGAAAGDEVAIASETGSPGSAPGQRSAASMANEGPTLDGSETAGGPSRSQTSSAGPIGASVLAEVPEMGPQAAVAQAELDHNMGGMGDSPMSRNSGDAIAVNIEAPEGPGGLGSDFTPQVGLNNRQARADSVDVQVRTARFVRQAVGGLPSVSTTAIIATDSFSRRTSRTPGTDSGGGKGAPPPQTEEAIELGLEFLARNQQPDGSWSLQGFGEETNLVSDTGATALSLLSFQGAGYNHREHQYKDVVRSALDYLVKNQKEDGDLFLPLDDQSNQSVWLYSHSLATIALCEAYGMTQDPALKEPAQKAIDFIVKAQHPDRGGWRYSPGVSADTSVTGWMTMALKSGELAKLEVPQETYGKIQKWLDSAQASSEKPHEYRYNPVAPDTIEQRHGRAPTKTMTAVGLLMRLYTGWRRDNPNMINGAEYLKDNLPAIGSARQPERDTYYWYYATQVMFHMKGDYWQQWNAKLHPMLVNTQIQQGPMAGSWNPRGPVPDRWGPHGGRIYVTTMNLLSLEVYYRHLPLYEDTAK